MQSLTYCDLCEPYDHDTAPRSIVIANSVLSEFAKNGLELFAMLLFSSMVKMGNEQKENEREKKRKQT